MEQKVKRREWVKTAAIVFLSVLLILTFFSNTIMNRSLPEVATQVVQSGSINAQIRGNGTISAEETYDVTISQSRKVQSVKARVGDEVKTGDVLFVLDPAESSELQAAREALENMELAYQQSMITASNSAAQENRSIQKLRDSYNEALAAYQMYSNIDPAKLNTQLAAANATLKSLNRDLEDAREAVTNAQSDESYLENKATYESLKTEIENLSNQIEELKNQRTELQTGTSNTDYNRAVADANQSVITTRKQYEIDELIYKRDRDLLWKYALFIEEANQPGQVIPDYIEENYKLYRIDSDDSSLTDSQRKLKKKLKDNMTAYAKENSLLSRTLKELIDRQPFVDGLNSWELEKYPTNAEIKEMATAYSVWTTSEEEMTQEEIDAHSQQKIQCQDSYELLKKYATFIIYAETYQSTQSFPNYYTASNNVSEYNVEQFMKQFNNDWNCLNERLTAILENESIANGLDQWELQKEPNGLTLENMATAFNTLESDIQAIAEAEKVLARLNEDDTTGDTIKKLNDKIQKAEGDRSTKSLEYNSLKNIISATENRIEQLKAIQKRAQENVDNQNDVVERLSDAQREASALTSAKEALEDALFELSLGDTDALRLQKDKEDIEKQKALITELEEKSDAVEVKARVSGVISAVNITAGNTANAETPLATITIKDRGYTVRISCTADQSRRVTIGDQAKLSNYYSGGVTATLEKIIPDPQNPQTGRFLVFRLTGEGVQPGSNVTLAIGQKSATYEALIPNSALRSDTNGNYVLVVVEKSNALSTRYTARRVDVTVLASDDTQTAVVGLSPGDFVITTSNRPIEAGAQVRLPDAS